MSALAGRKSHAGAAVRRRAAPRVKRMRKKPARSTGLELNQSGPSAPVETRGAGTVLRTVRDKDETPSEALSRAALTPIVHAARAAAYFNDFARDQEKPGTFGALAPGLDAGDLAHELANQCRRVARGDLARVTAILTAQSHTLDAMFNQLAARAAINFPQGFEAAERYMRLALKAQAQCRATLEAIAEIKSPRPVFVQQANIANGGPQQVNNARVERDGKSADQTFGARADGQRMDGAPATPAGITHSSLETLGSLDGPAHAAREEARSDERVQGRHEGNAASDSPRTSRAAA